LEIESNAFSKASLLNFYLPTSKADSFSMASIGHFSPDIASRKTLKLDSFGLKILYMFETSSFYFKIALVFPGFISSESTIISFIVRMK
jgi:hypothetical protein